MLCINDHGKPKNFQIKRDPSNHSFNFGGKDHKNIEMVVRSLKYESQWFILFLLLAQKMTHTDSVVLLSVWEQASHLIYVDKLCTILI